MRGRNDRTPQKRGKFLAELARTGYVIKAAACVGISQSVIYAWRSEDAVFAAEWDAALEAYTQKMEAEADRRALEGTLRPVFYQGEEVGVIREYSDTLLIFRLNGQRPEKYRQRLEHTGKDGGPIEATVNVKTSIVEALTLAYGTQTPDSTTLSVGSGALNGHTPAG